MILQHHIIIYHFNSKQNNKNYYSQSGVWISTTNPLTNTVDVNSRFQPFVNSHLTSSFTSLSQTLPSTTTTTTNIDDFNNSIVDGNSKLNALGLGGGEGGGGNTNNTLTGNDNVTTTTTTNSTSGF